MRIIAADSAPRLSFRSSVICNGHLPHKRDLWLAHAVRDLHLSGRLRAHLLLQDLDEAPRHQPVAYQPGAEIMSAHDRYSDGDREDLEWEEIFSGAADIRALKLPPAIENDLDNFVDTAVAQPDTAFKACEQLTALSKPNNCLHALLHCHTGPELVQYAEIEGCIRQAKDSLHDGSLSQ